TRETLRSRLQKSLVGGEAEPVIEQISDVRKFAKERGKRQRQVPRPKPAGLFETTFGTLPRALLFDTPKLILEKSPEVLGNLLDPQRTKPTARTLGRALGTIGATAAQLGIPGLLPASLASSAGQRVGLGVQEGGASGSTPEAIFETAKEVATLGGFKIASKLGKIGQIAVGTAMAAPAAKTAIDAATEVREQGGSFADQMRSAVDNGVSQLVAYAIVGRLNAAREKQLKKPSEIGGPAVRKQIERDIRAARKSSGADVVAQAGDLL
ncbi:unnamed protein product, partial [marine sediment metagenome]